MSQPGSTFGGWLAMSAPWRTFSHTTSIADVQRLTSYCLSGIMYLRMQQMGFHRLSLLLAARVASWALALLLATLAFFWAAICCAMESPSAESLSGLSESESKEEEDSDNDSDKDSSISSFTAVALLGGWPWWCHCAIFNFPFTLIFSPLFAVHKFIFPHLLLWMHVFLPFNLSHDPWPPLHLMTSYNLMWLFDDYTLLLLSFTYSLFSLFNSE